VPVHQVVGDGCMTYKDGERVQREFREAFDRGDTLELDFDKTRIFVTAFFNAAVASLLENCSRDELERRLKIVNCRRPQKSCWITRSTMRIATITMQISGTCVSAIQIVRPLASIAETQRQLQPVLLRLSAMISQYFTRQSLRDLLSIPQSIWIRRKNVIPRASFAFRSSISREQAEKNKRPFRASHANTRRHFNRRKLPSHSATPHKRRI
jgi:hypothetical protein